MELKKPIKTTKPSETTKPDNWNYKQNEQIKLKQQFKDLFEREGKLNKHKVRIEFKQNAQNNTTKR